MDIPVSTRDALNNNSKSDAPPQLLDTSDTTLDLFHDLQDSAYSSKATSLPKLLLPTAPSLNKKRDLDDLIASSSDAPLFSSDDLLASNSENYLDRHRHKRQHRRLWYEEEGAGFQEAMDPFERPRIRGPFTRKYDSGVWMGSDESIESEQDRTDAVCKALRVMGEGGSIDGEDVVGDLESATLLSRTPTPEEKKSAALYRKALQMTEDPGDFEGPVFPYWGRQPDDDQLERFHTNQEFAYEKVMQCVDAGGEVVDLSTMNLQQIRAPTLKPLRDYVRQASQQGEIEDYQQLTPALRLYLSNNMLEEVPGEVYQLENLEVLSLRNNCLTEISPSISRLTNLRELNLGSNQLQWLPWEILLPLIDSDLEKCRAYPNPLMRPMPSIWSYQSRRSCDSDNPWPVASTRIAFLDATGASIRGWPPAPSSLSEHWGETVENGEFLGPVPEERTKIPSLMEVALRACYNSPQLSQLPFMLPEDSEDCPNHLSQLLKKTWKIKEAGGQSCSVCKSNYIVPRTEWVEWWHCLPREGTQAGLRQVPTHDQGPIPLLRRGCSWQCWEESDNPLNRGWNSTIMPGRREEPNEAAPSEVARNIQQPLRQRR